MNSAKGARTVRLPRAKSGLGFSIKGGKEHGIPIVVSWIQDGGAAASVLRLGDEILAVGGKPLQGLTHSQAVSRLTTSAGGAGGGRSTVTLRIKPNQTLGDVFSAEEQSYAGSRDRSDQSSTNEEPQFRVAGGAPEIQVPPPGSGVKVHSGPLPMGWVGKVDVKTGRAYFENHYTHTTTWTDPRWLVAKPLTDFEWNELPPGWQRFLDDQGDIYYVNHDTQSTHWDSPRGLRQQTQLREVHEFSSKQKEKLKIAERELQEMRELVLKKNQELQKVATNRLHPEATISVDCEGGEDGEGGEGGEGGDTSADIIDDIMLLNEEVEVQDRHLTVTRRHLKALSEILKQARFEDICETDEHTASAELAIQLASEFTHLKQTEKKLHQVVTSLEGLRKELDPSATATPLRYMLQLPPQQSAQDEGEMQRWLHTLPDRLTGKTNCEMRLELSILRECCAFAERLEQRLAVFCGGALSMQARGGGGGGGGGWEGLAEELAGVDFLPLQHHWMQAQFREKLEKLFSFD